MRRGLNMGPVENFSTNPQILEEMTKRQLHNNQEFERRLKKMPLRCLIFLGGRPQFPHTIHIWLCGICCTAPPSAAWGFLPGPCPECCRVALLLFWAFLCIALRLLTAGGRCGVLVKATVVSRSIPGVGGPAN